jgi:thiamine transporter ThiT
LSPDEATELVLSLVLDMGIWIPLLIMCPVAAFLIGLSFLFDEQRRKEQRRIATQALIITALAAVGLVLFWLFVQYVSF